MYLELRNITKKFSKVVANDNVSLSVTKGEIHALLGENGAGKSTLMNILYGMYPPTSGQIFIDGKEVHFKDAKEANSLGIAMVHQHFMLIPTLTVIENIILGHPEYKGVLNKKKAREKFLSLAKMYDLELNPDVKVSSLSVGEEQRLEILKALFRDAKILILDEPTAVLTPAEAKGLFKVMRTLKEKGLTIIFISHKLNEIFEICDNCTILRQGIVAGTKKVSDITSENELATLMVGHEVELDITKKDANLGRTILDIKDLNYFSHKKVQTLKDINLSIKEGEILGVCGVDGNGQSELVKCITGYIRKRKSGKITIKDDDVTFSKPSDILAHNVSHIPEDRMKMALVPSMNLVENYMLMSYNDSALQKYGFINFKKAQKLTEEICEKYSVRKGSIFDPITSLSGGNQQKLVAGREFERKPDLLIAMHPDRGLDISATRYIQNRILEQRDKGAAVLLVSAELDEILSLSDRIIVMCGGKITGTLDAKDATREKLGLLMVGHN